VVRRRSLRTAAVGPAKKYGEAEWARWELLYRAGLSLRRIAEQYRVAPSTVMRRLHGRGVDCRSGAPPRRVSTAAVERATAAGLPGNKVAAVTGVSATTVTRRQKESRGEPPMPSDVAQRSRAR
jgi:transposase